MSKLVFCFRKRVPRAGDRGGRARSCPGACGRERRATGVLLQERIHDDA